MLRQRLRTRVSNLALVGRIAVLILALALVWYGLMVALLAARVDAGTVNAISGYRSAFDTVSGLSPTDVDSGTTRLIVAGAGLVLSLVCTYLAIKELPRPYLVRHDLELEDSDLGMVTVQARAVERVAEMAACEAPGVSSASGRYQTEDVDVGISVSRAGELPTTLADVQQRVRSALDSHGLPPVPVHVNLVGFDRRTRREFK